MEGRKLTPDFVSSIRQCFAAQVQKPYLRCIERSASHPGDPAQGLIKMTSDYAFIPSHLTRCFQYPIYPGVTQVFFHTIPVFTHLHEVAPLRCFAGFNICHFCYRIQITIWA
jgi:hypothetical protein